MKKYSIVLFPTLLIFILTIASCKKIDKPEVFIKQDVMAEILCDLYLADGLLNNPVIRNDFANVDSTVNYMRVIEAWLQHVRIRVQYRVLL